MNEQFDIDGNVTATPEWTDWDIIAKSQAKTMDLLGQYDRISCSISGGSDSDIMLDLVVRNAPDLSKVHFIFFDTGIEYQATKEHLDYLEDRYGIKIERLKAKIPVPLGVKKMGVPFISKDISAKIYSLQHNKFDFTNDGTLSAQELKAKYPKCNKGVGWWTNTSGYRFNIERFLGLKEYMTEHPPTFNISDRCCWGAKKSGAHEYTKKNNIQLELVGVRQAEGGIRATTYKNCFTFEWGKETQMYRPIFWYRDSTKRMYEEEYGIVHSRCYAEYGMKRTGCAGCPFNSRFQEDLKVLEQYEPKLYKAVCNIFGESYAYTEAYRQFKKELRNRKGQCEGQMSLFEEEGESQ